MKRTLAWLGDAEWALIEPFLPRGRKRGASGRYRRAIPGIVPMLKSGARWRDGPSEYGPSTTIYNRWSRQGIWLGMFETPTGHSGVRGTVAIDATHVKAHRSAGGAKRGPSRKPPASRAAAGPASSPD